VIVFVDFDGTITDVDTLDTLVSANAGDAFWDVIGDGLRDGTLTLRDALERETACIRMTKAQALTFLDANANVDPAFASFVATARKNGVAVRVLSAGIGTVIHHLLERAGVDVPVIANDVDFAPDGWTMSFVDASDYGHDKSVHVREAQAAGQYTVYVGDGISDFDAALVADRRFAKKNRALEAYCRERGVACTGFTSFAQIERELFPSG
jgi:2,3-diketo-5-methylthio-1-phosphopentane phosphatase